MNTDLDDLLRVDDGLGIVPPKLSCWQRHRNHILLGLLFFSVVVNVAMFIELNIVVAELVRVQKTIPDAIDDYVTDLMGTVSNLVENQVDGVVETTVDRVGAQLSNTIINNTNALMPKLIGVVKQALVDEFNTPNITDMIVNLEKIIRYICVTYPQMCMSQFL